MIDERKLIAELDKCLTGYDEKGNAIEKDNCFMRVKDFKAIVDRQTKNEKTEPLELEVITEERKQYSWDMIRRAAEEGNLGNILLSGDRIPITLTNGEKIELEVGRDKTGRTYFIFYNALDERHCMNEEWTNKGGWEASDMRRYANEEVFTLLPDEIRDSITPTRIVQVIDGERHETDDWLFCLSATQVFGECDDENMEPEDSQIDIYEVARNRVKEWRGSASWWWLRSAYYGNNFNYVYSDGSNDSNYANSSGGVVLSFCIKESNI